MVGVSILLIISLDRMSAYGILSSMYTISPRLVTNTTSTTTVPPNICIYIMIAYLSDGFWYSLHCTSQSKFDSSVKSYLVSYRDVHWIRSLVCHTHSLRE